jgi:hypothetical protein
LAGSGPRHLRKAVNVRDAVGEWNSMTLRSRHTSFFGARQVAFERLQERLGALDVVRVIALELND